MKIAFIGSEGMIGQSIIAQLEDHHELVTYGRSPHHHKKLDLLDLDTITEELFKDVDVLVHCAGIIDEDFKESSLHGFKKGIVASKAVFEAAYNAGTRTFIYISSAHVYGPLKGHIDETTPPFPLSDYALCHYASEQILRRLFEQNQGKDMHTLVLRPCATYGSLKDIHHFQRWSLIPFNLPRQAVLNGKIELYPGSDTVVRNFVSADDLGRHADIFLQGIQQEKSGSFHTINPVGVYNDTIYNFALLCAQTYKKVFNKECPLTIRKDSGIAFPSQNFQYDTVYVQDSPKTSIEDYIKDIMVTLASSRAKERAV
ncbi:MAG: SDR family oxidoreductase [Rhodospirillales bacterium]|nr:SDR family oxidoreductase [Rhodospirillales bacterium]